MANQYEKKIVALLFHKSKPKVLNPSKTRLEKFDDDLYQIYETVLEQEMTNAGIQKTKAKKSYVLALAYVSGIRNRIAAVRGACKYYNHLKTISWLPGSS